MTSDIVITLRIGQSAGKISKSVMLGYDIPSTTARVSVDNDGLINLNLLKIQSSPYMKIYGSTRLMEMKLTLVSNRRLLK